MAAFNVNGFTIHNLLKLYPNKDNESMYSPLNKISQKLVMDKFEENKLIIFDEYSMISNEMLETIHLRLEEISARERSQCNINDVAYEKINSFGGLNILLGKL